MIAGLTPASRDASARIDREATFQDETEALRRRLLFRLQFDDLLIRPISATQNPRAARLKELRQPKGLGSRGRRRGWNRLLPQGRTSVGIRPGMWNPEAFHRFDSAWLRQGVDEGKCRPGGRACDEAQR